MNRIALAFAALLAGAGAVAARDLPALDGGTQAFRAVIHFAGMTPIEALSDALEEPRDSIIVLFGPCRNCDAMLSRGALAHFVERGGALLAASDRPIETIGGQFGISVAEVLLHGPENDPSSLYRGELVECPLVRHPTQTYPFQRFKNVATNLPGFLRTVEMGSRIVPEPLAYLPGNCWWENQRGRRKLSEIEPPTFAFGGKFGRGRYLFLADHSVFINTMMLQKDNDNIPYALAIVEWLGDNGRRKKLFFCEEGTARTQFDLDLDQMTPPLPHPDVLGPAIDQFVQGIERENVFDRLFKEKVPTRVLMRTLLLAGSVVVVAFALYFVTASRLRLDPRTPRLPDQLAGLADPSTPAELRRRDCHAADARELVRRTFEGWGEAAPVVASAGVFARRTWTRRIARLATIAAGNDAAPPPLTDLARELAAVQAAIARGELRLGSA